MEILPDIAISHLFIQVIMGEIAFIQWEKLLLSHWN